MHFQQQQICSGHTLESGCSQLLFEKSENENEREGSWHVQAFLLPFLFSFFAAGILRALFASSLSLTVPHPKSIYLSVRNLRV